MQSSPGTLNPIALPSTPDKLDGQTLQDVGTVCYEVAPYPKSGCSTGRGWEIPTGQASKSGEAAVMACMAFTPTPNTTASPSITSCPPFELLTVSLQQPQSLIIAFVLPNSSSSSSSSGSSSPVCLFACYMVCQNPWHLPQSPPSPFLSCSQAACSSHKPAALCSASVVLVLFL